MQIKSPMFGSAEIAEDKIIEFPMGLPGFEDCRRWTLVHGVVKSRIERRLQMRRQGMPRS